MIQPIKVSNLLNYYENPRHAIGSNEKDTLKKLFDSVGTQYMLNLAEDIQKNGLMGNQQVAVVYSDDVHKYVVYEGNRRVAVVKLLLDPNYFDFLDKATIEKAKKIAKRGNIPDTINCYVTDEKNAFFIMERTHSGEDKGRGIKQWSSREKAAFKARQSHEKKISYLIDFYIKKYFDGFDITTILSFTTIQRIFNNSEVRKQIGLDISDESSFTVARMQLIIDASKWIKDEAEASNMAITRLFNKSKAIEDKLIPWIQKYMQERKVDNSNIANQRMLSKETEHKSDDSVTSDKSDVTHSDIPDVKIEGNSGQQNRTTEKNGEKRSKSNLGGYKNLPYFFQGIDYSNLNPNDAETHGVAEVCKELQLFSEKKLVSTYPVAAAFLVRAVIEQSIIYYAKKHNIQGQDKLIWENIKNIGKLSKIIENYKKNLPNYITDSTMRQYFESLFKNYEDNIDPLNWVVHRPAEFQLDAGTLVELPKKGLLTLINFMLSK